MIHYNATGCRRVEFQNEMGGDLGEEFFSDSNQFRIYSGN